MTTSSAQTILGIDPGYDRLGWAIAVPYQRTIQLLAAGCIQTNARQTHTQRYLQLQTELSSLLEQYQPTVAAIETLFFSKNTTTALRVSEARGVVIGELIRNQVTIFDYNPMRMKQVVTGTGSADKAAVAKMLKLQVKLPSNKLIDDTLDAVGLCLTHALLHTSP